MLNRQLLVCVHKPGTKKWYEQYLFQNGVINYPKKIEVETDACTLKGYITSYFKTWLNWTANCAH